MPANVEIDPATANAQGTDFQTTAFQTEDGGQSRYLTTFSYAGGSSTYSFGLYQFDALGNPLVAPFLGAIGFSGPEIAELQQHGGLSSSTLNALDSQLSAAVATQSGQAAYQGLLNTSDANYAQAVQTDLDDACLLYTSPSPRDRQKSRMPS